MPLSPLRSWPWLPRPPRTQLNPLSRDTIPLGSTVGAGCFPTFLEILRFRLHILFSEMTGCEGLEVDSFVQGYAPTVTSPLSYRLGTY